MKSLRIVAPLAITATFLTTQFAVQAAPTAPAHITFAGGDGSTVEKAVIIKGATEMTGVHAEYEWLAKHFPGAKPGEQALISNQGRSYDLLHFKTPDGKSHEAYFDITDFFGK